MAEFNLATAVKEFRSHSESLRRLKAGNASTQTNVARNRHRQARSNVARGLIRHGHAIVSDALYAEAKSLAQVAYYHGDTVQDKQVRAYWQGVLRQRRALIRKALAHSKEKVGV